MLDIWLILSSLWLVPLLEAGSVHLVKGTHLNLAIEYVLLVESETAGGA